VNTLAQTLTSANVALRLELLVLSSSLVEQASGVYASIGPDAQVRQLAGRLLIRPLDEFVRSTAHIRLDDYFPGALDAVRVDGKLYGLPLSVMPPMLLYDKELLESAGVAIPIGGWNWQQLLDAGLKGTKPPLQYALAPASLNVGMFVEQNGGAILSADGTRCLLDQPAAVEAAGFYAGLFQPRTIVAPPGTVNLSFDHGMLSVGGARIALLPNWLSASIPVEQGTPRRLYLAEPFHGKVPYSSLGLQDAVVMTTATTDPASSFLVMAALASQLQQQLFVPATLSTAKVVDPGQQGLSLDGEEKTAILRTARYAAYAVSPGPDVIALLRSLDAALQGGQDPFVACQGGDDSDQCGAVRARVSVRRRSSGGDSDGAIPHPRGMVDRSEGGGGWWIHLRRGMDPGGLVRRRLARRSGCGRA